jgi:hypothetical protein
LAAATISFPIPLETPPGPGKVHYLTLAQTKEGPAVPGCPGTGSAVLEHPVAEPGNLCVYTGVETIKNDPTSKLPEASFMGFQNALGETEKASRTGAFVTFGSTLAITNPNANLGVQGSWAVTAP